MQGLQQGPPRPGHLTTTGVKKERLQLIMAILVKHMHMKALSFADLYVNVTSGLALTEPATDLAIAVAIASSYFDQQALGRTVVLGELGEPCSIAALAGLKAVRCRVGVNEPACLGHATVRLCVRLTALHGRVR